MRMDATPHKFRPVTLSATSLRRSQTRPSFGRIGRNSFYLLLCLFIFVGLLALLPLHHAPSTDSLNQATSDTKTNSASIDLQHVSDAKGFKLAVASHGRLLWYYPSTGEVKVLHEGEGVHYGTFPGDKGPDGRLKTLWVIVRPHNWHPTDTYEVLLELDATTGAELKRKKIPSRFTHDVVRSGDSVWVCNTDKGQVLELKAGSMELVRTLDLFTKKEHLNTLAPLRPGKIWALLHNLGMSELALIDLYGSDGAPLVTARIKNVGKSSHGLVEYRGGWLILDSDRSSLVWIEDTQGLLSSNGQSNGISSRGKNGRRGQSRRMIHNVASITDPNAESQHLSLSHSSSPPLSVLSLEAVRHVLWSAPEGGKFLKGLCVVDNVAYFGVSVFSPRSARQDPLADSEMASFDLLRFQLKSRDRVPTHGLLNVISAPHLGEKSTYQALRTSSQADVVTDESWRASLKGALSTAAVKIELVDKATDDSRPLTHQEDPSDHEDKRLSLIDDATVLEASRKLKAMGFQPNIGGSWPTGLPYLDLKSKGSGESWKAGIQLPLLMVNVSHLRSLVVNCPPRMWEPETQRLENAVIDGRQGNTDKYKPGVKAMYLMFSDRSTANVYRFAYYDNFKAAIIPLLEVIIGSSEMSKIVRMQLALMPPSTTIKAHRDMGGYALKGHRIHIPVTTNPDVSFQVCPTLDENSKHQAGKEVRDESIVEGDCLPIPMLEGMVFEVNNRVLHRVENRGQEGRVTLVVDVAEDTRHPKGLLPGTVCNYIQSNMVCDKSRIVE